MAILPALLSSTPYQTVLEQIVWVVRWPAFFAIAIIALGILYKVGPSRRAPRFVWVLPGASVAALAWVGASYLFGWYVSTLSDYTATYGSLAAIVVFMTWLWLSVTIMLIGAELNAELEHQTAHDTTHGPPKPLVRGARSLPTMSDPPSRGDDQRNARFSRFRDRWHAEAVSALRSRDSQS